MNNRIAKELKKQIYGSNNPRVRTYTHQQKMDSKGVVYSTRTILADVNRKQYQALKREYMRNK